MKYLFALAVAGLLATPLSAQQTALTSQEVRVTSAAFLAEGDYARAAAFADLILAVDPNDLDALLIRARAAQELGDFRTAAILSKRAYRATSNQRLKFVTARLAALAHAEQRQDTFAQLWLRRARQFAPDEANSEQVARDYRFLADRNPWSTSLRFGITPSSNVNNGTTQRTTTFPGLPFVFSLSGEARALSGLEYSAGVATRYRLNVNEKSATFLDFDVSGRTYTLSKEAQEQAPDAKGSDFSDANLGFGITHRRILAEGQRPTTFSARLGQTWYSGDPFSRTLDLSVAHSWKISDQMLVGATLSAQERQSLDDNPTVRTYSYSSSVTKVFDNRDRLRVSLSLRDAQSDTPDSDYDSVRLSTNYDFAEPFAGMKFGFGFDVEERNFDNSIYVEGTRVDQNASARVRVQFTEVEFYGFQPVATFEATRNASNSNLFDRDYVNFGFDLQSSF